MPRFSNSRNRRKRRGGMAMGGLRQVLRHTFCRDITSSRSEITAGPLGVVLTRPARPAFVKVQYLIANVNTSHAFQFSVENAAGEEVYNSPPMLAGIMPRTVSARMPAGTDFGLYATTAPVVIISSGTTSSATLDVVVWVDMQYKDVALASPC